jgi:hypothetical protein
MTGEFTWPLDPMVNYSCPEDRKTLGTKSEKNAAFCGTLHHITLIYKLRIKHKKVLHSSLQRQ